MLWVYDSVFEDRKGGEGGFGSDPGRLQLEGTVSSARMKHGLVLTQEILGCDPEFRRCCSKRRNSMREDESLFEYRNLRASV